MFPSQTSFIPVTVALAKFIESNGFGGLYPYWYLGTTPVKYLIGPVVPGLLIGLHKALPNSSFFDLSYLLLLVAFFLFSLGWGLLAVRLSESRRVGLLAGILSFLMPWHWFAAFGLSEVSAVLATSMTPWVLLAFARISNFKLVPFSDEKQISNLLAPSAAFALLLLTNSTAAIPAIVGLLVVSISNRFRFLTESKYQISNMKNVAAIILISWVLATLWYGVDYWLTIFGAPSIGGKSAVSAFVNLLNLLRGFVPVILAVILVWWRIQPKTAYDKFVLSWLAVFGSFTLFRFMADWDFWIDWTSWMGEVEVGVALVAAMLVKSAKLKVQSLRNLFGIWSLVIGVYIVGGWFFAWQKRDFWLPRVAIENTAEYRVAGKLSEIVDADETVFLSGSAAFWLNSLVDVRQVRGGRDEVSKNANWRSLNWQLTQGENLNVVLGSLAARGVDFVVVHNNESGEYYHDFKNPQGFEAIGSLEKVYEMKGDIIYQIK